jgi:hypothetical protein
LIFVWDVRLYLFNGMINLLVITDGGFD